MARIVCIGECMVELSGGDGGLFRLGFAGDTFNTAAYLGRLLPDASVDYLSAVGDDLYSTQMLAFMAEQGVGTTHVRRIAGRRPGLYAIHQQDGDRQFTYWRDSAAARQLADAPEALAAGLDEAQLAYFSGITLGILSPERRGDLLAALRAAARQGTRIAFDPNIRPALWSDNAALTGAISEAAAIAHMVLPTHADEAPYFGDADGQATVARYLSAGVDEVVVKNGAAPALIATADRPDPVAVPGETVARVVDATGAGDSFNAGYIAARLGGADPVAATRAAHRVAARVIGVSGALLPRDAALG